jgi:choice-of-anchor C domain-containing protein
VIRASIARFGLALLVICAFTLGKPAAAQNLVTNGSFEVGVNPGLFHQVNAGDTDITGWHVTNGSVDYIGTLWVAQDGERSIDMSGSVAGTMAQQTIATTIGQEYLVSFWMAGNPEGPPVIKTLDVSFGGGPMSFTFDTTGRDKNNMGWALKSFLITATGTSTDLTFQSTTGGLYGPAIDNISVIATDSNVVPEVGGLVNMAAALMGPGLGLLAMRRRARKGLADTVVAV